MKINKSATKRHPDHEKASTGVAGISHEHVEAYGFPAEAKISEGTNTSKGIAPDAPAVD